MGTNAAARQGLQEGVLGQQLQQARMRSMQKHGRCWPRGQLFRPKADR